MACADSFRSASSCNPRAALITGSVCGVRVEPVDDPLTKRIRPLDMPVDEPAGEKPLEKILR